VLQIAPSTYYAARARPPSARAVRDAELVEDIKVAHKANLGVYGARKILADGIVPADIVLTNPQYCIPCAGVRPPHGVYAHICGIDLIRTGPDAFCVLEDNARTPSGVSYMIENRDAMLRLCPELFDIFPVRPVDSYPELLRETLYSVAPPGGSREPRCVLLTPGHHNSAFYEHSFLADNMGIELVEGTDLVVDDDRVFMKTIAGYGSNST